MKNPRMPSRKITLDGTTFEKLQQWAKEENKSPAAFIAYLVEVYEEAWMERLKWHAEYSSTHSTPDII